MKNPYFIKQALGKSPTFSPRYVGQRGGRKVYEVTFYDGTSKDYYIDFDNETIEPVEPEPQKITLQYSITALRAMRAQLVRLNRKEYETHGNTAHCQELWAKIEKIDAEIEKRKRGE